MRHVGKEHEAEEHQGPRGDSGDRDTEVDDRVGPQDREPDRRHRQHVPEVAGVVAHVEVEEHGREDAHRQRRQVAAEPRPGHPQRGHGQDHVGGHQQELDRRAGGERRRTNPHRDRPIDDAGGQNDSLRAHHDRGHSGLRQPQGHGAHYRHQRERVHEGEPARLTCAP